MTTGCHVGPGRGRFPLLGGSVTGCSSANCGFAAHYSSSSWVIGATTSHPDRQWHLVPFLSVSMSIG
jgi:hypothetical protein